MNPEQRFPFANLMGNYVGYPIMQVRLMVARVRGEKENYEEKDFIKLNRNGCCRWWSSFAFSLRSPCY